MQPERSTVTRIRAFVKGIKCCNASSHPASHWPMWAHIPLPFCPEWFHRKDKLELCACFLVFRWSLSAVTSHTWVRHMGRIPLFCWSLCQKRCSEGFPIAVLRWTSSFENKVPNPAASFEGLQCRRTCNCGMTPSSWLHQKSTKIYAGTLAC